MEREKASRNLIFVVETYRRELSLSNTRWTLLNLSGDCVELFTGGTYQIGIRATFLG